MNIFEMFKSKFLSTLDLVGKRINETPTKKRERKNQISNFPFINMSKIPFAKQIQKTKEFFGWKGSGYMGKGNVNTGTRTFNRPRKDLPAGRNYK